VILYKSPIYTAEKFWHGSDEKSTRTKETGSGRIYFVVSVNYFAPSVLDQTFTRARTMDKIWIKLVRDPENLAQLE